MYRGLSDKRLGIGVYDIIATIRNLQKPILIIKAPTLPRPLRSVPGLERHGLSDSNNTPQKNSADGHVEYKIWAQKLSRCCRAWRCLDFRNESFEPYGNWLSIAA